MGENEQFRWDQGRQPYSLRELVDTLEGDAEDNCQRDRVEAPYNANIQEINLKSEHDHHDDKDSRG